MAPDPNGQPDDDDEKEESNDTALHSGTDTWGDARYEDQLGNDDD